MYTLILLSRQKWREREQIVRRPQREARKSLEAFFLCLSPVLKPIPNSSNNQGNSFFTCLIFIFIVFVMNLGHTQINDDCRDNRHQKQNKKQLLASIHRAEHGFKRESKQKLHIWSQN